MEDENFGDTNFGNEEIKSELTGLNKGDKDQKKKQIIIGIAASAFLVVILVIIIILATSNSKKKLKFIGDINCIYDIQSLESMIISEDYKKTTKFDIYVDNNLIKYEKKHKFPKTGKYNITIKLYNTVNIDYMFKGIKDLISVDMESNNKGKITSMISTFENCQNLDRFTIKGFDVTQLSSTHKLFYKTSLKSFFFKDFNSENLEDISYMFAETSLGIFTMKDINTKKVINMSHLFENCYTLQFTDFSYLDTSNVKDMSFMYCN